MLQASGNTNANIFQNIHIDHKRFDALFCFIQSYFQHIDYVLEVLNVHVNENEKKILLFLRLFFATSEKLTFEQENAI